MNPRFDVGKSPEEPKPAPEEPSAAGPEIPIPEQPVPQSEEVREDETKAAGPEMVIEEPPKAGIPSEESTQVSQAPRGGRILETDVTGHDIDIAGAADLQGRISEANQS